MEQLYQVGDFTFQVLFTPGHSADSISFYFEDEKKMFVGDFVFQDSIGRCDLPTGDFKQMQKSIERLKTYPGEIILYPGHGEITTVSQELNNNPYFQ